MNSSELPLVVLLATGGTIVSSGDDPTQLTGYRIKDFRVEKLISSVPALADTARLEAKQVANIDSMSMTSRIWMKLAREIEAAAARPEVAGVVVTHGTDTMEETAYFLNLVLKTKKPVVLTGAMRPATAISADGPLNLLNAVRTACDPQAAGMGVLIAVNDIICGARDASKVNPTNAAAFRGVNAGAAALIAGSHIVWLAKPLKAHTSATPFSLDRLEALLKLPRVDIVASHADDDGVMVRAALAAGADAIVHLGTGNGSIHEEAQKALFEAAAQGVLVIRASRTSEGCVTEGLSEWQDAGFIPAGTLSAQKARILAQVAIAHWGRDQKKTAEAFRLY